MQKCNNVLLDKWAPYHRVVGVEVFLRFEVCFSLFVRIGKMYSAFKNTFIVVLWWKRKAIASQKKLTVFERLFPTKLGEEGEKIEIFCYRWLPICIRDE